jgi:hypothetical protein
LFGVEFVAEALYSGFPCGGIDGYEVGEVGRGEVEICWELLGGGRGGRRGGLGLACIGCREFRDRIETG